MDNKDRPLLVLIHGWGFDSGVFKSLIGIVEHRFRIQTIDLPGYGDQKLVGKSSLSDLALFVSDQVSETAIFLGWSMGGLLALELAKNHPEKVKSLILMTSTPCFAKKENWLQAMDRSILENFVSAYNKEPEQTLDRFSYLASEGNKNPRNWIRELKKLSSKVAPIVLEQGLQVLLNTDLRENLKDLKIPTLMIFGEKDSLVPVGAEKEIGLLNRKIRTKIIPGSGHTPFLTDTDLVAETIIDHSL